MAWIPLSSTDILNSLTEAEQSGTSSESSQSDLTVIVSSVSNLVRGKVNSSKRNQGRLGPEGTIPDELYAAAISIARFKYLTHLPGTQLITKERAADKDEAYAQLEAVATDELVVITADDEFEQTEVVSADTGSSGPAGMVGPNLQGPCNGNSSGWPFWDGYW
jgi:hypothetical protein